MLINKVHKFRYWFVDINKFIFEEISTCPNNHDRNIIKLVKFTKYEQILLLHNFVNILIDGMILHIINS